MSKQRVVVTGLGMLTALGLSVESTWKGILKSQSGASMITAFDTTAFPCRFSASLTGFNPELFGITTKDVKKMDPFIQYGLAAAIEAFNDAQLDCEQINLERIGVAVGSGIGGLFSIEQTHTQYLNGGPRKISPFFIPATIINMLAGHISIRYGFKGPNIAMISACTTGTHNIGEAARMIERGDVDVMFAGGSEMATTPLGLGGFAACRALSRRNDAPTAASRPWDKDRDGFLLGDGAGVVVLESYEHAKKRNAKIYGEVAGYGTSSDAFHITSPSPNGEGAIASMRNAMKDAEVNPSDIDYINAHATSTYAGDECEAQAITQILGSHAKHVAVSSTKSMTGHLLGAAGAAEAIFCLLALRDQVAPPTINLDNPSDNCTLDFVPHTARSMPLDTVLSNSFGFGGANASLVFKKI
ncbi:MAG: beta-ketoacyl-ACP synthase II [Gammaproteobacteria bacterium]|nr:beta-ketoacyl-ACP synthase II [Gammaproteobacteria bacterium]